MSKLFIISNTAGLSRLCFTLPWNLLNLTAGIYIWNPGLKGKYIESIFKSQYARRGFVRARKLDRQNHVFIISPKFCEKSWKQDCQNNNICSKEYQSKKRGVQLIGSKLAFDSKWLRFKARWGVKHFSFDFELQSHDCHVKLLISIYELHGSLRQSGAVEPGSRIKKTQLSTTQYVAKKRKCWSFTFGRP